MIPPLVGFHAGVTGNRDGLGRYFQALDEAAIPFALCSVDDAGLVVEAAQYRNAAHVIVFRNTEDRQGRSLDVPMHDGTADHYTETPTHYVARLWDRLADSPELLAVRDRIWIGILNECDQNQVDWLARFALAVARQVNAAGWRVLVLNWAAGTPREAALESRDHIELLRYCADNPDRCAYGLHEYAYSDNLLDGYPWKVGRWRLIEAAAIRAGIAKRPRIMCKEFGWHASSVPSPDIALAQLAALYGQDQSPHPHMVWALGPDWGGTVNNDAQRLIAPLTEFVLHNRYPVHPYEGSTMTVHPTSVPSDIGTWNPYGYALSIAIHAAEGNWRPSSEEWQDRASGWHYQAARNPDNLLRIYGVPHGRWDAVEVVWPVPPHANPRPADWLVVDLSHWNGRAHDYAALKHMIAAVVFKATEGITGNDPAFQSEISAAKRAGLLVGAYLFLREGNPDQQAENYWRALQAAGGVDLLPIIDYERLVDDCPIPPSALLRCIDRVKALTNQTRVIVYTGNHYVGRLTSAERDMLRVRTDILYWWAQYPKGYQTWPSLPGGVPEKPTGEPMRPAGFDWAIWQFTSSGRLQGIRDETIDLNALSGSVTGLIAPGLRAEPPLDLLHYMQGGTRAYRTRTVLGANAGHEEIFYYLHESGGIWRLVKNTAWEEFRVTPDWLQRGRDTSEGNGRMYGQYESQGGPLFANWCPRWWQVGGVATVRPFVQHFNKATCEPLNADYVPGEIRFLARHQALTICGEVFNDVIEIGRPGAERYWYALGVGMVQWQNDATGELSHWWEWVGGDRESPEVIGCG